MKLNRPRLRQQSGAALVVGLLLLLVITVLAVAGMNSAGVEFIMAGNEQYHSRAFQAAEAGIEQSIANGTFNPGDSAQQHVDGQLTVTSTSKDDYAAVITRQLSGTPLPAIWGNTWNSFVTYHFEIQSSGTSVRNSLSVNTQGVAVISPWDATILPDPSLGGTQLTATASSSGSGSGDSSGSGSSGSGSGSGGGSSGPGGGF